MLLNTEIIILIHVFNPINFAFTANFMEDFHAFLHVKGSLIHFASTPDLHEIPFASGVWYYQIIITVLELKTFQFRYKTQKRNGYPIFI